MRLDKTRTAQEQRVANLFRLLGFSIKTDYRPQKRELDVFAVLGPLTIAVECKDYSEASVGKGNIEEFSQKLREVGNLLGVFVANRFTPVETELCDELGIAHWKTSEVENELKVLRAKQHKHVPVGLDVWNLLAALKTYATLWSDYIEDWVVQHEIIDTPLFEENGLIEVDRSGGKFSYTKTELGEEFFNQFCQIRVLTANDGIGEWEDRCEAAGIIGNACSWDNITAPSSSWDRMVLASLNIHRVVDFQLTPFGRCLGSTMAQICSRCESESDSC